MEKRPGQITLAELNPYGVVLPGKYHRYLKDLYIALNEIRFGWGYPMVVTSGVRPWEQHVFIYKKINAERALKNLDEIETPKSSAHLIGAAADIYDPGGLFYKFLVSGLCDESGIPNYLEKFDLFIEDKRYTPEHVHLQVRVSDQHGKNPSRQIFIPH